MPRWAAAGVLLPRCFLHVSAPPGPVAAVNSWPPAHGQGSREGTCPNIATWAPLPVGPGGRTSREQPLLRPSLLAWTARSVRRLSPHWTCFTATTGCEFLESSREPRWASGPMAQPHIAEGFIYYQNLTEKQTAIYTSAGSVRKVSALASELQVRLLSVPPPSRAHSLSRQLPLPRPLRGRWGVISPSRPPTVGPRDLPPAQQCCPRAPQRPGSWPQGRWAGLVTWAPWDICPGPQAFGSLPAAWAPGLPPSQ